MPIRVEIYTASGVAIGLIAREGRLREVLESASTVELEQATWHPLDDGAQKGPATLRLAVDEIQVVTGEEMDEVPVHAQWHEVALEAGPFAIGGQMPTMPGFDPGRALARPTGQFVQLRDATIGLTAERDNALGRPAVLVNRYVVDRVEADLMLGFFFPGATMISTQPDEPIASAGADSTASSPGGGEPPLAADILVPSKTALIPFGGPPGQ
jgi:hypothetical protein